MYVTLFGNQLISCIKKQCIVLNIIFLKGKFIKVHFFEKNFPYHMSVPHIIQQHHKPVLTLFTVSVATSTMRFHTLIFGIKEISEKQN